MTKTIFTLDELIILDDAMEMKINKMRTRQEQYTERYGATESFNQDVYHGYCILEEKYTELQDKIKDSIGKLREIDD